MKPSYPLLVSDLDGTLLNSKNQITDQTKQAIDEYTRVGGLFTIATGRTFIECENFLQELNIDLPVVLSNGALLYFPQTKEVQVVKTLADQIVDQLLINISKINPKTSILIFSPTQIYSLRISDEKADEFAQYGIQTVPIHSPTQIREKIMKVQMIGSASDGHALHALAMKQPFRKECDFVQSHDFYFEILPKGISKGNALNDINRLLDVPARKTAAIGDQCNDLTMLQLSGLAAAVANAHPLVKQYATHQVPTNDQNGVAHLIENFLLAEDI